MQYYDVNVPWYSGYDVSRSELGRVHSPSGSFEDKTPWKFGVRASSPTSSRMRCGGWARSSASGGRPQATGIGAQC